LEHTNTWKYFDILGEDESGALMPITNLGTVTVGVAVPGAVEANAALLISANIAVPNVTGQITALASFSPQLSLSFADQLTLAADISANISAAIAAIPPIPTLTLSAQIALAASVLADLNATLATINAQLTIQANLASLLSTAGVSLLRWSGNNNDFGPALTTYLGGATTPEDGIIMYTANGATFTAMSGILKVS
jgi:hypothetical protein